jgi:glycosyltransferase involved in cell wall biosynthesis
MTPKILVFIPAYRCATQITRVIDQFDEHVQAWVHTVMVVDNQSPDNTLEAAIARGKLVLQQCNFIGWRNDDNYGLGGSHKAAFRYAIEQGFDYLVVLHGDDQADIRSGGTSGSRLPSWCPFHARQPAQRVFVVPHAGQSRIQCSVLDSRHAGHL